jgi:hypothetical protein
MAVLLGAVTGVSGSVSAQRPVDVTQAFGGLLRPVASGERVILGSVTLEDGSEVALDVSPVEVFTAGTRIVVHDDAGEHRIAPPSDRWFAGRVLGDADSLVVLALGQNVRGLIASGGRVSAIAPEGDPYQEGTAGRTLVRTVSAADVPDSFRSFTCDAESLPPPERLPRTEFLSSADLSSVMYYAEIAVETDYELYAKLGNVSKLTKYVGDLFAAATFVYQRDVLVTLQVDYLSIWATSSDPWTGATSTAALSEFVNYWGTNRTAVPRTVAHMLAGRSLGGGIAYMSQLCGGAGYGVSGQLSGTSPSNYTTTYWDFLVVTHELGHNFGSSHTHCYSPPVDTCCTCATESQCSSGVGRGSVPPEKGTIMSYCHVVGGYGAIKMFLGVPGEPSAVVATTIRSYVESRASCLATAPGPVVTSASPSAGPTAGGTGLTITGTGFATGATVKIGGTAATSVTVVDATTITAVTPAHALGTVDVAVLNPGNQWYSLSGGYRYGSPPVPASVLPNGGSTAGGSQVTITGTGFQSGATVTIGGIAATNVVVGGPASLTATTGARAAGLADVVVTNPDTLAGMLASSYTYTATSAAMRFYTLPPCRILDTRADSGFPTGYGPPSMAGGVPRNFVLTGRCGIPSSAKAVSINAAAWAPVTPGDLRVYGAGGVIPVVSLLNWEADILALSHAGILQLGTGGAITAQVGGAGTVDLILDVNGYFQ